MSATRPHPREAIAERNLTAILDAAERLLQRGQQPSVSAVATEAGVSRPTVYAHFPDRQQLLEALVQRTVGQAMTEIDAAEPDRGSAYEALERVVAASWAQLARHEDVARAAAAELGADSMHQSHEAARAVLRRLFERGRTDGSLRKDLPASWLATSTLALIHGAADSARAGELADDDALAVLLVSVRDLVSGQRKAAAKRRRS